MTPRYSPPYIPDGVKRPRLFALLDAHGHNRNFLVTGQAAQGKSTLVTSYVGTLDSPSLWFHLTPDDSDRTKLAERLLTGISREAFDHDDAFRDVVIPGSTLGTEKEVLRHVEVLFHLLANLPSRLVLVMDDLESLDRDSSGLQLINDILDSRFENLVLFLLSRREPAINIPKLKMARSLFVLNNEDLAFTLEETEAFFKGRPGVDRKAVKRIHEVTAGWAGGLALISESVRQSGGMAHLPEKLSAEVFDYFSREIYKSLPDTIRTVLVKTSVLDIIDPDVLSAFFDDLDPMDILTELEHRNLFVQRISLDHGQTGFRYHKLFRDFLLQELVKKEGVNALEQMNRTAGQVFWEKKDHETAIEYFIRARAFTDVVRIIQIKGTDYVIRGKLAALKKWIFALPEEMVEADPWLIFFRTMGWRIRGGKKNIRDFRKAYALFEEQTDVRGMMLTIGFMVEAAVFLRLPSQMILDWITKGEDLLRRIRQDNRFPWARAILWQQIGLGYIAGDGNIPKGVSACRNAILLSRRINNPDLILNASVAMTFGYVQAGDFVNAGKMLEKMKDMTQEGRHPEYRALKSIVDINFALKKGRFDEARERLSRSEADIEKFGLIFLYPGFVEARALYLIFTGRFDEARQMADHLNDFSILEGNDFYKGICHRLKALSYFLENRVEPAMEQVELALAGLDQERKGDIHHFLTQQLAGLILAQGNDLEGATKKLAAAADYFERISSDLSHTETCFALGTVLWDSGEPRAALGFLIQGLEKACKETYTFFPLLPESVLVNALLILVSRGKAHHCTESVCALILGCDRKIVYDTMDHLMASCSKKEKPGCMAHLSVIHRALLPRIRIETLGGFQVFSNGRPLDHRTFEGARPLLLLKSIVRRGMTDIPKEILIDDLWPKATAKAGEKNFKINLHRLRKAMEPGRKTAFGHAYLIQKTGLVSLDPELVTLDVDEFVRLENRAAKKEKQGDYDAALFLCDRAVDIYRGDFLAEEPYLEWVWQKREALRARYIDLLQRKARLHEELDQIDRAAASWNLMLKADPCSETAYQNLMILYADSGRRSMALALFTQCCSILKTELGTDPDEQTRRLYHKIKSG